MPAILTTPSGKEHVFSSIKDAVRTLVIATDVLTIRDAKDILHGFNNSPSAVYTNYGWTLKNDLEVRGKGKAIVGIYLSSGQEVWYDTMKLCCAATGIGNSKLREIVDIPNRSYRGMVFRRNNTPNPPTMNAGEKRNDW